MRTIKWYEVSPKDWDKLMESEREIFLTPICGQPEGTPNSLRLSMAVHQQAVEDHNIKPLRKINS